MDCPSVSGDYRSNIPNRKDHTQKVYSLPINFPVNEVNAESPTLVDRKWTVIDENSRVEKCVSFLKNMLFVFEHYKVESKVTARVRELLETIDPADDIDIWEFRNWVIDAYLDNANRKDYETLEDFIFCYFPKNLDELKGLNKLALYYYDGTKVANSDDAHALASKLYNEKDLFIDLEQIGLRFIPSEHREAYFMMLCRLSADNEKLDDLFKYLLHVKYFVGIIVFTQVLRRNPKDRFFYHEQATILLAKLGNQNPEKQHTLKDILIGLKEFV